MIGALGLRALNSRSGGAREGEHAQAHEGARRASERPIGATFWILCFACPQRGARKQADNSAADVSLGLEPVGRAAITAVRRPPPASSLLTRRSGGARQAPLPPWRHDTASPPIQVDTDRVNVHIAPQGYPIPIGLGTDSVRFVVADAGDDGARGRCGRASAALARGRSGYRAWVFK